MWKNRGGKKKCEQQSTSTAVGNGGDSTRQKWTYVDLEGSETAYTHLIYPARRMS